MRNHSFFIFLSSNPKSSLLFTDTYLEKSKQIRLLFNFQQKADILICHDVFSLSGGLTSNCCSIRQTNITNDRNYAENRKSIASLCGFRAKSRCDWAYWLQWYRAETNNGFPVFVCFVCFLKYLIYQNAAEFAIVVKEVIHILFPHTLFDPL